MKSFPSIPLSIVWITLVAFLGRIHSETSTTTPVDLDGNNFEEFIGEKGTTFVKFYAPWCGYCKKLAPTWDELAQQIKPQDKVNIAKVDCTTRTNRELCLLFQVSGYPTLKLITKDAQNNSHFFETPYAGDRSLAHMKDFALKTKPSTVVEKTKSLKYTEPSNRATPTTPEKKKESEPVKWSEGSLVKSITAENVRNISQGAWMIDFYADWCAFCQELIPIYEEAANLLTGEVQLAKVNMEEALGRSLMHVFGVDRIPTLKLIRDGKVYNVTYAHPAKSEELVTFAKSTWKTTQSLPLPSLENLNAQEDEAVSPLDHLIYSYPMELGIIAGLIIFVLGFILGRMTAIAAPPPSAVKGSKKQQ